MKLLKIKVTGLKLFKGDFEVDFFASQRVSESNKDMLYEISPQIYLNNIISFIGINASGKTTALKVISFVIKMLNNNPINRIENSIILHGLNENEEITIESYFYRNSQTIQKLETVIKKNLAEAKQENKYYIKSESLFIKSLKDVFTKKSICDFISIEPYLVRNNEEKFLQEDVSIMIASNKEYNERLYLDDLIFINDVNFLWSSGEIPTTVIEYLDPSIESLKISRDTESIEVFEIRLKFKGKEEIILNNAIEINNYLSSGTIKGIGVFLKAVKVFREGGYLLIDELENHFNKEIVMTLVRFFMNPNSNKNGGSLIFSTHYPEILDEFVRTDDINIVRNDNGIFTQKLSDILERNDIKKSDVYQSGFLEGTTPVYESYIKLKNAIVSGNLEA